MTKFDDFKNNLKRYNSELKIMNTVLKTLLVIELFLIIIVLIVAFNERLLSIVREKDILFWIVFILPIMILGMITVICIDKYTNIKTRKKEQKKYDNYNFLENELNDEKTKKFETDIALYLTSNYLISISTLYGVLAIRYADIKSIKPKEVNLRSPKIGQLAHLLSIEIKTDQQKYEISEKYYNEKDEFELIYNSILEKLQIKN